MGQALSYSSHIFADFVNDNLRLNFTKFKNISAQFRVSRNFSQLLTLPNVKSNGYGWYRQSSELRRTIRYPLLIIRERESYRSVQKRLRQEALLRSAAHPPRMESDMIRLANLACQVEANSVKVRKARCYLVEKSVFGRFLLCHCLRQDYWNLNFFLRFR